MEDAYDDLPEFTLAEILEMEKVFKGRGEEALSEELYQELATKFSCSPHHTGKTAIKWEQVQNWFHEKQNAEAAKKLSGERVSKLSGLVFEAKSAKDEAWFDVCTFLKYRVVSTGELEVRVRFAGFGNEEDEWVNIKRAVRERSIPLEPSECDRVRVGDMVLCFRECDDNDLYIDARILAIRRRLHDNRSCECMFLVRFDCDNTEAFIIDSPGQFELKKKEVRVRFAGFGNEEDEWVNIKRAKHERSIPLEPLECDRVRVGDMVLCFRACNDNDLYIDARVLAIRRRLHDNRSCECMFLVRFECDNIEEVRVRFADFGNEEDEWVNIKSEVRERSIPLEPSECDRVRVEDMVLCFRACDDNDLYIDARVLTI